MALLTNTRVLNFILKILISSFQLKITDKLAKREDTPATSKDFNSWLDKCGSGTLCAVELEDLHLKGKEW